MEERVRQLEEEERRRKEAANQRGANERDMDEGDETNPAEPTNPPEPMRRGSSEATGAASQSARGEREAGSPYDPS
jgi:hypothetical protein